MRRVFDVLLRCTDDYATDKRGDVGSWVRQAALRGLRDMTKLAVLASTLAPTLRPVTPLGVGDKVSSRTHCAQFTRNRDLKEYTHRDRHQKVFRTPR